MPVSNVIERTVDIDNGIKQEDLHRLFAVADARAHTFKITVTSKGIPQSLSGHTVIGYFMTNYYGTVVINGSVSNNVATLILPATCYANNTGFQLIIRLVSGSTKTAIYWGTGYVTRSATDPVIDPGSVVPDLDDILAEFDQMEQATQAANTAADNANAAASKSIRYDTAQSLTDAQKAQAKSNIGFSVDDTLTIQGEAADAKKTGDEISDLKDDLGDIGDVLQIDFNDVTPSLSLGGYTGGVGSVIGTNSDANWRRCSISVNEGETYKISFRTFGYSSPLTYIWLCDENDVIKSIIQENTATISVTEEIVIVESNVSKIYIRGYNNGATGIVLSVAKKSSVIDDIENELKNITGLSDDAKGALLSCFEHVTWVGNDGYDYYNALAEALYDSTQYITVKFSQGNDIFFTDDSIDELKNNLVVIYHNGSERTTLTASDYTLSGSLNVGQSTITVTYQTYTAKFKVSAIENIASTLANIHHPTVAASGTYTINGGVLSVKSASQSAVDNWWTWIIDSKGAYWNDVVNKTIYCRIKVKKTESTDEDGYIGWVLSMTNSDTPASVNDTRRHTFYNINPTSDYVKYTESVLAKVENFTAGGSITPGANTKIGNQIFIRTLDTINFAEIKMGVM